MWGFPLRSECICQVHWAQSVAGNLTLCTSFYPREQHFYRLCESCNLLSMESLQDELNTVCSVFLRVCMCFVCVCGLTVYLHHILLLSSRLYLLRNTRLSPLNQSARKKKQKQKTSQPVSKETSWILTVSQLPCLSKSINCSFVVTAVCVDPVLVQFVTINTRRGGLFSGSV